MMNSNFSEVRGQKLAVDACERAVRERKNLLLIGPPGVGKTMIARRIPSILPDLSELERCWIAAELDGAMMGPGYSTIVRPFRAPHHTVSEAGLVGAISPAATCGHKTHKGCLPRLPIKRAGEAQLARFGVLFLDEVIEFRVSALHELAHTIRTMANTAPMIVASANPCPCGWRGMTDAVGTAHPCTCSERAIDAYLARLLKVTTILKLEIVAHVAPVTLADMRGLADGESSEAIRARLATVGCVWNVANDVSVNAHFAPDAWEGTGWDLQGAKVSLDRDGRTFLGDVRAVYRDENSAVRLQVRHFNGESWPFDPLASEVTAIPYDAS